MQELSFDQALVLLKKEEVLWFCDKSSCGIAFVVGSDKALKQALALTDISFEKFSLLIGEIGQFYDYVEKIPDMAWDIAEYTDRALDLVLPRGKNLSRELLGPKEEVKLRWVKGGDLHKLLFKLRKALVFIPTRENLNFPFKGKLVFKGKNYLKSDRTMQLGLDGEFHIDH
ncbi:hypothetical protein [Xanthovirga aplysinae]|uniref:hypothetical protein n=1 Tax=Xanthovirga aplysinae TaxID=2529853 RepID=UPI0012BC1854|nr:hypothetical protein [Xanthovirga aplysinae]MTI30564.1 hypothetical protein [Xanthovirga aplysinae]